MVERTGENKSEALWLSKEEQGALMLCARASIRQVDPALLFCDESDYQAFREKKNNTKSHALVWLKNSLPYSR